jgi:hypothetical protein
VNLLRQVEGGLTTKIHLLCNELGLRVFFRITAGQVGNALRLKDAKVFSIVEGEQREWRRHCGSPTHLHQVAGEVAAKGSDGHLLLGGSIQLLYADDHSVAQRTRINEDGKFVLSLDEAYLFKKRVAADRPQKYCSDLPGANHAD